MLSLFRHLESLHYHSKHTYKFTYGRSAGQDYTKENFNDRQTFGCDGFTQIHTSFSVRVEKSLYCYLKFFGRENHLCVSKLNVFQHYAKPVKCKRKVFSFQMDIFGITWFHCILRNTSN